MFPKRNAWPIGTLAKARTAAGYLLAGRGKPAEWPKVWRALNKRWGKDGEVKKLLNRYLSKGPPPSKRAKANKPSTGKRATSTGLELLQADGSKKAYKGTWYKVPGNAPVAVHGKGAAWTLTHRFSGLALGRNFKSKATALRAFKSAHRKVPDVPWRWFRWDLASDRTHKMVRKLVKELNRADR